MSSTTRNNVYTLPVENLVDLWQLRWGPALVYSSDISAEFWPIAAALLAADLLEPAYVMRARCMQPGVCAPRAGITFRLRGPRDGAA